MTIYATSSSINTTNPDDPPDVIAYKNLWRQFKDMPSNDADRMKLFKEKVPSGSRWWPSDISWAQPEEPGVYPLDDFKNQR